MSQIRPVLVSREEARREEGCTLVFEAVNDGIKSTQVGSGSRISR